MLALFIDTNVLLSFYAFTQDDLERLDLLAERAERGELAILLTPQIRAEYLRNREAKIAESVGEMTRQSLSGKMPRLCDAYEELTDLRRAMRDYENSRGKLVDKIREDVAAHSLKADLVIQRLFEAGTELPEDDAVHAHARHRVDVGNPPGKRGSLGDAINWEALLARGPNGPVFFITDDRDFYSAYDPSRPNEFLIAEWGARVGSPIRFVRRLSDLPEEDVPREALPVDEPPDERVALIQDLQSSANFTDTHRLIADLSRFSSFEPDQAEALIDALDNSQVRWILIDQDVHDFYSELQSNSLAGVPEDVIKKLADLLESHPIDR